MDILAQSHVEAEDPELFAAIAGEEGRQKENLELIASENYASKAVREAMACLLGKAAQCWQTARVMHRHC